MLIVNFSLNQTLLAFMFYRRHSSDSGNFSMRGYLPLNWKDCSTHIYGLTVYVKGLPFALDLSLENSTDPYLCFRLTLLRSVSYSSFPYRSPSLSLCLFFDSISSNIEVLSINPPANGFVFGDFNSHHKEWLAYSGGTDRPSELCYISDLIQMVNFPIEILDCDSYSLALLDLFLSSDASICSIIASFPLGNSDHIVVSVPIEFPSSSQ